MIVEIKIPSPGESITEVEIAEWLVENGTFVEKNQDIAEIESEKATLNLVADESGKIEVLISAGETAEVGAIACKIDTSVSVEKSSETEKTENKTEEKSESTTKNNQQKVEQNKELELKQSDENKNVKITPLAKKLMHEKGLSVEDIIKGLKRIGKDEIELAEEGLNLPESENVINLPAKRQISRETHSEKMSMLRRKIAERLVAVKNETAMLTTFNEIDMSPVIDMRKKYQKQFVDKFGVKVGFMSFFIKAASEALLFYPEVNAMIDGDHIVFHDYTDIGIAVQSPKGLVVPVLRNTESLSLADIELKIKDFATRGRENKLALDELKNGTFTITNGGTFGSLLSTPIINPPQSGILGMHNIVERPMAINGKVEIKPMMYVALSYDHRLIDGKSAVSFLVKIKELIENPIGLLFEGKSPEEVVLGL